MPKTMTAVMAVVLTMIALLIPAFGQTQEQTYKVDEVAGSPFTVSKDATFGDQTLAPGANTKIGSYNVATATVATFGAVAILTNVQSVKNLRVVVNGVQFGTTQASVAVGTIYAFTGRVSFAASATQNVSVYADILSGSSGTFNPATVVTGIGSYNVAGSLVATPVGVDGQALTLSTTTTALTIYINGSTPSASVVMGAPGVALSDFYASNPGAEDIKITDLTFTDQTSATAGFNNLQLWQNVAVVSTAGPAQSSVVGGYQYAVHLVTPVIVAKGTAIPFMFKGDAEAWASAVATVHSFGVTAIQATGVFTGRVAVLDASRSFNGSITVLPSVPVPIVKAIIPATGSNQPALVAGGLFSLFGPDLCGVVSDDTTVQATVTANTPNLPKIGALPIEAGRCRAKIDGQYMPLLFGMTWDKLNPHQSQINGQLPQGLAVGAHSVVVENRAYSDDSLVATSAPFAITTVANNPSLFVASAMGPQVILQDLNSQLITASNPAGPGSILTAYGTQFGPLQTPLPDGSSPSLIGMSTLDLVQIPVQAWLKVKKPDGTLSSYSATCLFAGASPQFVGVEQINVQLPTTGLSVDPASTTAFLILTQGGVQTQDYAFAFAPTKQ